MTKEEHHKWLISRRIVCEEGGYPLCEARFANIFEYVEYLEKRKEVETECVWLA